jgi:hypothetical protein
MRTSMQLAPTVQDDPSDSLSSLQCFYNLLLLLAAGTRGRLRQRRLGEGA